MMSETGEVTHRAAKHRQMSMKSFIPRANGFLFLSVLRSDSLPALRGSPCSYGSYPGLADSPWAEALGAAPQLSERFLSVERFSASPIFCARRS